MSPRPRKADAAPVSPGEAAERDREPHGREPEETPEAPPDEQIDAEPRGDRPPEPVEPEPEPEPERQPSSSTRAKRRRSLERRIHTWLGELQRVEDESSPTGIREYATGMAGVLYVLDPFDGQIVAMHAPNMARAYAELADESPRFARFLELAMSGGATGAAIFATLPPVLAIAAHHGLDLTAPLLRIRERRGSTFATIAPDGTAHLTPDEPAPPPPPVA